MCFYLHSVLTSVVSQPYVELALLTVLHYGTSGQVRHLRDVFCVCRKVMYVRLNFLDVSAFCGTVGGKMILNQLPDSLTFAKQTESESQVMIIEA